MDSNSRGNCRTAPVIALPQGFREIPRLWTGFSYGALPEAKTRSKMVSVRIDPRVALNPRSPASYFPPKCEFQQRQCLRRCKRGVGTPTLLQTLGNWKRSARCSPQGHVLDKAHLLLGKLMTNGFVPIQHLCDLVEELPNGVSILRSKRVASV